MIVAIEGMDQAGKRTQSMMLQRALRERHMTSKIFHFPNYKTRIGAEIARLLRAGGRDDRVPQVLHCLQAANRWEHLEKIKRACSKYDVVIMDRYFYSNLAYGSAGGISSKWLAGLDAGLPEADIVILLDIAVSESFQRRSDNRDKFEEDRTFLEAVCRKYKSMAKKKGWQTIPAAGPKQQVHLGVLDAVMAEVGAVVADAGGKRGAAAPKRGPRRRQAVTEGEARIQT